MQTFSVVNPLGVVVAKLSPKADSFVVKFTAQALRLGMTFGPSFRHDVIGAAHYLTKETAAVSCVCSGYTVSK